MAFCVLRSWISVRVRPFSHSVLPGSRSNLWNFWAPHIAALLLRAISGRSPGLVVGGRERIHGGDSKSSSESIMLRFVSCCSIMLRRIVQPCVDGLQAKLYQSKKKEAGCGRWHLLEVPLELLRGPLVEKEARSAEEGSARASGTVATRSHRLSVRQKWENGGAAARSRHRAGTHNTHTRMHTHTRRG